MSDEVQDEKKNESSASLLCRRSSLLLWGVVAIAPGACSSDRTPKFGAMYEMRPDETHLVARFPGNEKEGLPEVTFRIPREDIITKRNRLWPDGSFHSVWIFLGADDSPELLRAYGELRPGSLSSGNKVARESEHPRFLMELGGSNGPHSRARRGPDVDQVHETPYLGFERFSVLLCANDSSGNYFTEKNGWPQRLATKPADGLSPEGCLYSRTTSYLTNSFREDQGEDAIDIECMPSKCYLYIQVERRAVMMGLRHDLLPIAPALAKAAQAKLRSYVVPSEIKK